MSLPKYQLKDHLAELKSRILFILVFFLLAFLASYYFSEKIFQILLQPLIDIYQGQDRRIIYTGLTEAFFSYLNLSAFAAFCASIPIIALQTYLFIRPGLYKSEKILAAWIFIFSPLLFLLGSLFVYYLVMPKAWGFFLSFEMADSAVPLMLEARISEYLTLITKLILAFGLAFQMPVILVIFSLLGLVSSKMLSSKRRIAILINFIIAGLITPPDILSQIALAIPMLLLYEIGVATCKYIEKRPKNA
jgi:sec-independent protein translocase protein TatC